MLADVLRRVVGEGTNTLYDEGANEGAWVVGFSNGAGSQSKESDHLFLRAGPLISSEDNHQRTWVTDVAYDMTDIDKVEFEWEISGATGSGNYRSAVVVSDNKTGHIDQYDRRSLTTGTTSRTTSFVDVSTLTGERFVRVHVTTEGASRDTLLYRATLIPAA